MVKKALRAAATAAVTASVLAVADPALAAPTNTIRLEISDDRLVSVFFSEICDFEVFRSSVGYVTIHEFEGKRLQRVANVNLVTTLEGPTGTLELRSAGSSTVRSTDDGSLTFTIAGRVPIFGGGIDFGFIGVAKIDPETEEFILFPQYTIEAEDDLCGALG